jgi:hypothetical protein
VQPTGALHGLFHAGFGPTTLTIDVLSLTTGIDRPSYNIVPCFACGATYIYKGRRGDLNGRFCSMRCQGAFDAGFTPAADPPADTLMKRTPNGFKIACAGCQKEFESTGPRCCSDACERRYRERQANLALMAEVGIEPSKKRPCAAPGCSSTIPKWRKGRQVSAATRFCSPACQKRAKRAMEQTPEPAQ